MILRTSRVDGKRTADRIPIDVSADLRSNDVYQQQQRSQGKPCDGLGPAMKLSRRRPAPQVGLSIPAQMTGRLRSVGRWPCSRLLCSQWPPWLVFVLTNPICGGYPRSTTSDLPAFDAGACLARSRALEMRSTSDCITRLADD